MFYRHVLRPSARPTLNILVTRATSHNPFCPSLTIVILRDLPPRILALILSNTHSPRDFHFLISARPACLDDFLTARTKSGPLVYPKEHDQPRFPAGCSGSHRNTPPVLGAAESCRRGSPNIDVFKRVTDSYFSTESIGFPRDTANVMSF